MQDTLFLDSVKGTQKAGSGYGGGGVKNEYKTTAERENVSWKSYKIN